MGHCHASMVSVLITPELDVDVEPVLEDDCPVDDCPEEVEPVEQASASAEDDGCDRDVDLVNQPRLQVLIDHGCPASKPDIPSPGGILGVRER